MTLDLKFESRTCAHAGCGQRFKPKRVFQRYCKTRCQANAAYQRRNGGTQKRRCKACGAMFLRGPERWAYCNGMCRDMARQAYSRSAEVVAYKRQHYLEQKAAALAKEDADP